MEEAWGAEPSPLAKSFGRIEDVARLERKRGPLVIETYALEVLQEPRGDVLDRSPPPEMR